MSILYIVYPEIPPTSNKIYFRGTILTKVAREYAERFAHFIVRNHLHEIEGLNKHGLYELSLCFYFPTVLNETWNNPKVKPSKRAKTRYKKFDLDNRIKLLQDCVKDAVQIDDSHVFEGHQYKFMDPFRPRVEASLAEVQPHYYGIPPVPPGAFIA